MRIAGQIKDRARAVILSDFLYMQEIDNQLRQGVDGSWEIWIIEEDRLYDAEKIIKEYLADPDDLKYRKTGSPAQKIRKQEQKKNDEYDKKYYSRTQIFSTLRGESFRINSVTGVLIAISVLITLVSYFGEVERIIKPFLITEYRIKGALITWNITLKEIRNGQIWRLVTPIFVHFGFMHIIFNMMWLKDLGSMIEKKHGPVIFLIMVIFMAVPSNLGQFFASGPLFGGFSGVVYGMLGYVWIRGKIDPASGFHLQKHIVIMMIVWFLLCLTGLMGSVANTAHAVGLGTGIAWGFISAKLKKRS